MNAEPAYGVSDHYVDAGGARYFSYQQSIGVMGGVLDSEKFISLVRPTDTVLDFGCGGGYVLAALICARKIGVDVNPAVKEIARQNGVEFYADLASIPDQTANVVISNHALEHVRAPLEALRALYDKLQPGGKLVLCVPIDDWRKKDLYSAGDIDHHLYTWTPLLLGNLLAEAGFIVQPDQIKVLKSAWPRYYQSLYRLCPRWVFDSLCFFWSGITKRRQVLAVVSRPLA
jgi:SAM-dependent methyltransferase